MNAEQQTEPDPVEVAPIIDGESEPEAEPIDDIESTIDEEILDAMDDSGDTFDEAGYRVGPWPEGEETTHIFLGFQLEKAAFVIGTKGDDDYREVPGYEVQGRYRSITGHDMPRDWGGAITSLPAKADRIVPTLPARTGRGCKAAVMAEMSRVKEMASKIVQCDPKDFDDIKDAVLKTNALAARSSVGVVVKVQSRKWKSKDGTREGERKKEFINDVFDAADVT